MEKDTEVEMEQISPAEKREDEDGKEDTGQETQGKTCQETQDKKDVKEEMENEYSTLVNPMENIYTLTKSPSDPKCHQDVNGRVRFYRIMSAILLLLCVLLLAVVLALAIKLSEVQTKQECPDVKTKTVTEDWSREKCMSVYPRQDPEYNGHLCSDCAKGWLKFEDSCFLLSNHRLNWQQSREECQKWGGDLAVISSERVQTFLTGKGGMLYWIGLHDIGTQQWTWINNTVLTQSYWSQTPTAGECALLRGWKSPQSNWYSNPCMTYSHYICQKG